MKKYTSPVAKQVSLHTEAVMLTASPTRTTSTQWTQKKESTSIWSETDEYNWLRD